MSRTITIALPPEKRRELVADLDIEGVVSITALPGASLKPPGDVLIVGVTNEGMQRVLGIVDRHQIGENASVETRP